MYISSVAILALAAWIIYLLWRVNQLKTGITNKIVPEIDKLEKNLASTINSKLLIAQQAVSMQMKFIIDCEMEKAIVSMSNGEGTEAIISHGDKMMRYLADLVVSIIETCSDKRIYANDMDIVEIIIPDINTFLFASFVDNNGNMKNKHGFKKIIYGYFMSCIADAFKKEGERILKQQSSNRPKKARKVI